MVSKLFIKNMVCSRCKMVVKSEFEKLGIHPIHVELGEIILEEEMDTARRQQISKALESYGFALIDDKKSQWIERIKNIIVNLVHYSEGPVDSNLSDIIAKDLRMDYPYLSNLFSEVEGITIEKYHIAQKIERVKELLVYNEFSLNEISYQLGYSSAGHLSNQFKKLTGLTPTHFKRLKEKKRMPLEDL